MGYVFLAAAILAEVTGTLSLRTAALGRRSFYLVVAIAYVAAFSLLSTALAHGIPLGVAYGMWTAVGVALTAIASKILFGEPLTALMGLGIALIMGGVVLVEFGSH